MTTLERQKRIIEFMLEKHFSTVKELAELVRYSEASVRRDLKKLEHDGLLKQIYGGVVLPEYERSVIPLALRERSNSAVKDGLAKKAAELVFDGATVILDGSSTVRRMVKYIGKYKGLKIVTNNIGVLEESDVNAEVYVTGGKFVKGEKVLVGAAAENFLRHINADIAFFSAQALSEDGVISDASEEETAIRRVMIERAKRSVFLCDSSKIGKTRAFTVATRNEVDEIICDDPKI